MAFSSCFCHSQISLKINHTGFPIRHPFINGMDRKPAVALKGANAESFGRQAPGKGSRLSSEWSFMGGSRVVVRTNLGTFHFYRKSSRLYASWLASPQLASNAFTWGTVAVLPYYALMVLAPKAELTKKSMESSLPYVVLGLLYAYLLYHSWTPDTIRFMFASKYLLPELPGIAKMFSSEMTLASAWIHLLAVDLFAARQVFIDGLENQIETRHSVSLCLMFCPIGIVTHVITKSLTKCSRNTNKQSV